MLTLLPQENPCCKIKSCFIPLITKMFMILTLLRERETSYDDFRELSFTASCHFKNDHKSSHANRKSERTCSIKSLYKIPQVFPDLSETLLSLWNNKQLQNKNCFLLLSQVVALFCNPNQDGTLVALIS